MRVKVYFNLHKKLFSIVAMEGSRKGLVIGHSAELNLRNPVFKVSEAGRQRVIRKKRKNVHAFVIGELSTYTEAIEHAPAFVPVTYNPYRFASFVTVEDEKPVRAGTFAHLSGRKITVTGINHGI